jgi:hypothetical protein
MKTRSILYWIAYAIVAGFLAVIVIGTAVIGAWFP